MRSLALAMLISCTPAAPTEVPDAQTPATPIAPSPPTPEPPEPVSDFRDGFWLVTSLQILPETDRDGDGVIDNKLPDVLFAIDELMRDQELSLEDINDNIVSNMENFVTVGFLEARSDGTMLDIDILNGTSLDGGDDLEIAPSSYDEQGNVQSTISGTMLSNSGYQASGELEMVVTMVPGFDPAPVRIENVTLSGSLSAAGIAGEMVGVLPVDSFIDEVIASMIPDEGFEVFPGTFSTKEEILDLVRDIAPSLADTTTPDGSLGVTAAFEVTGISWTLTP